MKSRDDEKMICRNIYLHDEKKEEVTKRGYAGSEVDERDFQEGRRRMGEEREKKSAYRKGNQK